MRDILILIVMVITMISDEFKWRILLAYMNHDIDSWYGKMK